MKPISNVNEMAVNTEKPIIELRNVEKYYKKSDTPALNKINLKINQGEFFGLLGPNAAGKTTTISIICGILAITRGDVTAYGINIKKSPHKIKNYIGLVPQNIALYPQLSVKENLIFFGELQGLRKNDLNRSIEKHLELTGLAKHKNKKIENCSGGIKRRTNLIVGILHNPLILFLDEPTVGVDAQSRNLIFENLTELNKNNMTMVYTTHYMEEAQKLCSRVAIIDNGEIIALDNPGALIKKTPGCKNLGEVYLKLTGKQLRE